MPSNSETILSNQVHGGDSTVQTVLGSKYKGDGYYGRSDGLHTVQYNLSGFIGKVVMQGTLAVDPDSTDWFDITNTQLDSLTDSSDYRDGGFIYNFTGNYIWVRAYVFDWTDGSVVSITLNH